MSAIVRLRVVGIIEGTTLLCLVGLAVPMKHFAGHPIYVSILGPIHGAVFLIYLLTLWETVLGGGWTRQDILRTALVSVVPFGTFVNEAFLRRKCRSSRPGASTADGTPRSAR